MATLTIAMPGRAVCLHSQPCNSYVSTVTILLSIEVNAKIVQEILGHVVPSMQRNARIECAWNCRGKHIICEENANLTIVPL